MRGKGENSGHVERSDGPLIDSRVSTDLLRIQPWSLDRRAQDKNTEDTDVREGRRKSRMNHGRAKRMR